MLKEKKLNLKFEFTALKKSFNNEIKIFYRSKCIKIKKKKTISWKSVQGKILMSLFKGIYFP